MLLEQLVEYGKRLEKNAGEAGTATLPSMYQEQPIRWILHLDLEGNLIGAPIPTSDGSGKKNDRGKRYATPHVIRTIGIKPKLLADNAEYVLGTPNLEKKRSEKADPVRSALEKHTAFKLEVEACAETTGVEEVRAVQKYLESLTDAPFVPPEGFSSDDNVSFSVNDVLPFAVSAVQSYWAGKFSSTETSNGDGPAREDVFHAECLISGEFGPVMEREPVKIKGIPDGQMSGMNLISANVAAFESYGLHASQIAPIKLALAEKYANALNTLLRDPYTHLRVGPLVYAFWTRSEPIPNLIETLKNPKANSRIAARRRGETPAPLEVNARAENVRDQLKGMFSGKVLEVNKPDAFYAVALSASGSRVVVREHITSTVQAVDDALSDFYEAQTMIDAEVMGVFELSASLYRDASKELVSSVPTALIAFALQRRPLPLAWLAQLVGRNRAEQRLTRPRAVMTKLILVANTPAAQRSQRMNELSKLSHAHADPGYQLGRFLAVLESLQYDALGDLNTTLVDRYYGSLSSTPVVAFSRLVANAQNHLSKLRKDPVKAGAAVNNDKLLQEILGQLGPSIPSTLTLESQAMFGLGYYHQRADRFARIEAAKLAKAEKAQNAQGGNA
jgi:CRISPR-associated protein Csd1